MVVPVEDARVEAHGLAPGGVEAIRDELRPTVAEVVRLLVLDLAREELGRLAASLNGGARPTSAMVLGGPQSPATATRALVEGSNPPPAAAARRRCSACGEEKPVRAFEEGRAQCRACRKEGARRRYHARQERARAAGGNGADPDADPPG